VCQQRGGGTGGSSGGEAEGWLSVGELDAIIDDAVVANLLVSELPSSLHVAENEFCRWLLSSIQEYCTSCGTSQLEFHDLSALLLRFARLYNVAEQQAAPSQPVAAGQRAGRPPSLTGASYEEIAKPSASAPTSPAQEWTSPTAFALQQAPVASAPKNNDDDDDDNMEDRCTRGPAPMGGSSALPAPKSSSPPAPEVPSFPNSPGGAQTSCSDESAAADREASVLASSKDAHSAENVISTRTPPSTATPDASPQNPLSPSAAEAATGSAAASSTEAGATTPSPAMKVDYSHSHI